MKNKGVLTISILPLMWILYILFEFFTGRITDSKTFFFNIILIVLFALVGLCIYKIGIKHESGFKFNILLFLFCLLLLIDQGIKILIKLLWFKKDIPILSNLLYFRPIINTDGSWLNARFGTSVSFPLLILLNVIALFIFIEVYRYYLHKGNKDFWADMCFIFVICGALCSLIDKVFYGGSLDFIGICNLFIADIKDLYINLGILFFALTLFNNGYMSSEESSSFKEDLQSLAKFLLFIKNDIFNKLNSL
ncbi:signal peptidase II [Clostridium saccharobutylicum]|uniref:Signal peptidase II n=1 Tax=Clostridium saccharobutylicum DSM 13864 TaxID=1345695 RepID=U5MXN9_CLOSA|nr:signal peptidase II [Clostridium saccharobutylicum]AGX45318.1 signal peptidase II [Clostridium saccharobutylicum DSM 13864]AQR92593.1 lipoprotein signal peptidase [Clostridium saccharobutylicum]AQS02495.1 lipoprotein signal peptidase [Clostridium saccharobutylicum]AQS12097.1 lipoprotein signal peptidase [Clostridium saccharobutylicum]AQS16478.1 lipoprotein signal peptidase [Clostridium saccharobutylicum]